MRTLVVLAGLTLGCATALAAEQPAAAPETPVAAPAPAAPATSEPAAPQSAQPATPATSATPAQNAAPAPTAAEQHPANGAQAAPGAAPTAPAVNSNKPVDPLALEKMGYKLVNENGKQLYCRRRLKTGSHVRYETTCLTAEELDALKDQTRSNMNDMMRQIPPPQAREGRG